MAETSSYIGSLISQSFSSLSSLLSMWGGWGGGGGGGGGGGRSGRGGGGGAGGGGLDIHRIRAVGEHARVRVHLQVVIHELVGVRVQVPVQQGE